MVLKMPLSKNIIEKEQADQLVLSFQPKSIEKVIGQTVIHYVEEQKKGSDFRVDKIVADYVGIGEIEKDSQQKEIARQALELSKEIQEEAYREAYQLGLQEGREAAYQEEKSRIESEMLTVSQLIHEMKNIKTNMVKENEKQIVKLTFYLARRLFLRELNQNPDSILILVKKTLEMIQSEEHLNIRVSSQDKAWIDQYRDNFFKEIDIDPNTKIEEDDKLHPGGAVIETSHGVIDATVEQRLEKLEKIVSEEMSGL